VVHTYNPSYSGDRDQEDHSLRPAQVKSYPDPILAKKLGMVVHICDSNYKGDVK
jgi:hypothetical protein